MIGIVTVYTTQLQAGLGMAEETNSLLALWREGMTAAQLSRVALDVGVFPSMSARRVRNVVQECFAPRYLVNNGYPAHAIKRLQPKLQSIEQRQLFFIYTCRANEILADFVRDVYWPFYSAGKSEIQKQDAIDFVVHSSQVGKMAVLWSDSTISRVSSYLIGCCGDFGLLEPGVRKKTRKFIPFSVRRKIALILIHDLHFSQQGDNAITAHPDWKLFGLEKYDVVEQLKSLSLEGHFFIQDVGGVVNIGWKYSDIQGVIDGISQ
jgi:hypothetical protein